MKRRSVSAAALAAALLVAALSGCDSASKAPAAPSAGPAAAEPSAPVRGLARDAETAVPPRPMPFDTKKAQLPKGFPVEVPIADGRIVRALEKDTAGRGVWLYDLQVSASADAVVAWYESAYGAAQWQLVDKVRETQKDLPAVRLRLRKGDAESVLRIVDGGGNHVTVSATIGLGVPVGNVY